MPEPRDGAQIYQYAGTWYMSWNDCLFVGVLNKNSFQECWVWRKVADAI